MLPQGTAIILLTNRNILLDPKLLFKTTVYYRRLYTKQENSKKKIASTYSEWLKIMPNPYAV